ncbi:hypothetical protein BJV74DRAFT_588864 [Russula compacta]|nr:hypothetical protein BJV74DRAFT_588864 [Russula compacta]
MACLWIQMSLADLVIIRRLYVVYENRLLVAAPALLLVTSYSAVGAVTLSRIYKARPGRDLFDVAISWVITYFTLAVSTNLICSGAIAWRIFLVGKRSGDARSLYPIILAIVESSTLLLWPSLPPSCPSFVAPSTLQRTLSSRLPASCFALSCSRSAFTSSVRQRLSRTVITTSVNQGSRRTEEESHRVMKMMMGPRRTRTSQGKPKRSQRHRSG